MSRRFAALFVTAFMLISASFAGEFNPLSYTPPLSTGRSILDVGVGLGSGVDFHAAYEIFDQVNIKSIKLPLSYGAGMDVSILAGLKLSAVGRVAWHMDFGMSIPLDVYLVLSLGLRGCNAAYVNSAGQADTRLELNIDAGIHAGARYFMTDKLAVFLELGYTSWTFAKVGASMLIQ